MVRWCAVRGCGNRNKNTKGESLFKLPAVIRHCDDMARKMSERRRIRWLARINRRDLTPSQLCESRSSLLVCSRHFVSGKPCGLFDDKNPDWAPSLHLGNGRDEKKVDKKTDQRKTRSRIAEANDDGNDDNDDGGDENDSNANVNTETEAEPAELELDFVRIPKKRKMYEDDMDWVAVRVELSKQRIKLHQCAQKLKKLKSQKELLLGKIECLQILANIDVDLLCRAINMRKHPKAKENWDKLYCLVMTIKSEENLRKICSDEGEIISDVEEDEDKGKKTGKKKKKDQKTQKKYAEPTEFHDVACQCQEKKKNKVQDTQVQTDINIISQLPDLAPKNKEQVYLVLEYGKDGKKMKVTASDNSPGQDQLNIESDSTMPGLSSSNSSIAMTNSSKTDHEVIKVPGVSSEPVNVIPVAGSLQQTKDTAYPTRPSENETQDISMPDFSTEPMDMLPDMDEEEENPSQPTTAAKQDTTQNDLKTESMSTKPTQPVRRPGRRGMRSVVERKVVIKKLQHPFLVQSPSNSTALVMSNSNRGGQYKVFRRETICKICGKVFPSMMDQQIHARIDHLGKKVYECEICGKKFSYENDLRRHTIYHTKQKNYQCSECGKTFVSHPGLVSHVESVHKGIKHKCHICGQEYIRKNSLRIHMAGKHNPKKQGKVVPEPVVAAVAGEPKPQQDLLHVGQGVLTQGLPMQRSATTQGMAMQGLPMQEMLTQGMQHIPSQAIYTQGITAHEIPTQGMSTQEMHTQGVPTQAISTPEMHTLGITTQAISTQEMYMHGIPTQAISTQEMHTQGIPTQAISTQEMLTQGIPTQGILTQALSTHALPTQGVLTQALSTHALPTQGIPTQHTEILSQVIPTHGFMTQGMPIHLLPPPLGFPTQAISSQGIPTQAISTQDLSEQAISAQGMSAQGILTQTIQTHELPMQALSAQGMCLERLTRYSDNVL